MAGHGDDLFTPGLYRSAVSSGAPHRPEHPGLGSGRVRRPARANAQVSGSAGAARVASTTLHCSGAVKHCKHCHGRMGRGGVRSQGPAGRAVPDT